MMGFGGLPFSLMSQSAECIYDFLAPELDGKDCPLSIYRGKVLLIANTASKGLYQKNLKGLHRLQQIFGDRPFAVLAFPCNQFFYQERKTNEKIRINYIEHHGYSFKVFSKVKVNGGDTNPIFKWLKGKAKGTIGKQITGNFTYFLVEGDGVTVHRYAPETSWSKLAWKIELAVREEEKKQKEEEGLPAPEQPPIEETMEKLTEQEPVEEQIEESAEEEAQEEQPAEAKPSEQQEVVSKEAGEEEVPAK